MRRLRVRISLRMFLLAFTALALWLGWQVSRSQRQQAALRSLQSAILVWDYQMTGQGLDAWDLDKTSGATWFVGPSGESLFNRVVGLVTLYGLSDEALAAIADLSDLRMLNLSNSGVDDESIAVVAELSQLRTLDLSMTSVTDAGLGHVGAATSLRRLRLNHTAVTDQGLESLAALTNLQTLDVEGTSVTEAGAQRLKTRLPHCEVWWGPNSSPQGVGEGAAPAVR
jgi:hypothetical protein